MGGAGKDRERDRQLGRCRAAWARVVERVISRKQRARDRRLLERRDDRLLRDIGIDRGAVEDESTASFWRLP